MIEESVVLWWLLCCYATCNLCYYLKWKKKKSCKRYCKEKREIFYKYISNGTTSLLLKNGSVPQDMLVLSVMTLSADLLRQIATDPHGFSRAHSIGNGLFNFPQGALPFPRYASLKQHPLLGLGTRRIFTEFCINSLQGLSAPNYSLIYSIYLLNQPLRFVLFVSVYLTLWRGISINTNEKCIVNAKYS